MSGQEFGEYLGESGGGQRCKRYGYQNCRGNLLIVSFFSLGTLRRVCALKRRRNKPIHSSKEPVQRSGLTGVLGKSSSGCIENPQSPCWGCGIMHMYADCKLMTCLSQDCLPFDRRGKGADAAQLWNWNIPGGPEDLETDLDRGG